MEELQFLINNHFPTLKKEKIYFLFHKEKDSFAYTIGLPYIGYRLYFSKKDYKKMTSNQIKGVLSHELSHIIYDKKRGLLITYFGNIFYRFNSKSLTKEERKVDKIAIEHGCAKYLIDFYTYHDKKYKKYKKKDGLTKKEIRKIIIDEKSKIL